MPNRISTTQLVLWPAGVTLLISVARYLLEVSGSMSTASGGAGQPLGISWLPFLFGGWFAWRLRRQGARLPPMPLPWLIALLLLAALVVTVAVNFGGLDPQADGDRARSQLASAAYVVALSAVGLCAMSFSIWPRLGSALLLYGVAARVPVLAITVLAKLLEQDTHYTKFGPLGLEYGFGLTLYRATFAQLLFWVPYTVLAGMASGAIVGTLVPPPRPSSPSDAPGSPPA